MLLEKLEAVSRLIGNTPVVKLDVGPGKVYVKLEYMNPTGSHKDRIAYYMLREAVSLGLLEESEKVMEASSGNTAISVSWVCNLLGLKPVIFTEDTVSRGKLALLRGLGAEIHLVPRRPYGDPGHYVNVARSFAEENGLVFLNQYDNEANFVRTTRLLALRYVGRSRASTHLLWGLGRAVLLLGSVNISAKICQA
jgi:cysteine synthase A